MTKKVGQYIERPGRVSGDEPITIPVAEDLMTTPGIPARDKDVSFYSREYPIENMAIEESASADWSREERERFTPESIEFFEEHQKNMDPIVEWVKVSGELEPIGTPTGEDVTDLIRQKARDLGYGEVGFTKNDAHYVYKSRKPAIRKDLPHAICLALEQDYQKTQTIPSMEAEDTHFGTYEDQGPLTMDLTAFIRRLGYNHPGVRPDVALRPHDPHVRCCRTRTAWRERPASVAPLRLKGPTSDRLHRCQYHLRRADRLRDPPVLPGVQGLRRPLSRPRPHAGQGLVQGR